MQYIIEEADSLHLGTRQGFAYILLSYEEQLPDIFPAAEFSHTL
jgi:hypothetical protein